MGPYMVKTYMLLYGLKNNLPIFPKYAASKWYSYFTKGKKTGF